MELILNCPICKEELYSGIGKGCKMCGMILEDEDNEFCCKICMRKFNTILRNKILKGGIKAQ
jgi:hypothetical protein